MALTDPERAPHEVLERLARHHRGAARWASQPNPRHPAVVAGGELAVAGTRSRSGPRRPRPQPASGLGRPPRITAHHVRPCATRIREAGPRRPKRAACSRRRGRSHPWMLDGRPRGPPRRRARSLAGLRALPPGAGPGPLADRGATRARTHVQASRPQRATRDVGGDRRLERTGNRSRRSLGSPGTARRATSSPSLRRAGAPLCRAARSCCRYARASRAYAASSGVGAVPLQRRRLAVRTRTRLGRRRARPLAACAAAGAAHAPLRLRTGPAAMTETLRHHRARRAAVRTRTCSAHRPSAIACRRTGGRAIEAARPPPSTPSSRAAWRRASPCPGREVLLVARRASSHGSPSNPPPHERRRRVSIHRRPTARRPRAAPQRPSPRVLRPARGRRSSSGRRLRDAPRPPGQGRAARAHPPLLRRLADLEQKNRQRSCPQTDDSDGSAASPRRVGAPRARGPRAARSRRGRARRSARRRVVPPRRQLSRDVRRDGGAASGVLRAGRAARLRVT